MENKKRRANTALGLALFLATVAISCSTGNEGEACPPGESCQPQTKFTEKEANQAYEQRIEKISREVKALRAEREPCYAREHQLRHEIRLAKNAVEESTDQLGLISKKKRTKKNLRKLHAVAKKLHRNQSELKKLKAAKKAHRNDAACSKALKALVPKWREKRDLERNREEWIFDYRRGKIK